MATKKQQRRRYQRAQGRGRLYDDHEPKPGSDAKPERSSPRRSTRVRGEPPKPTWRRSVRRAALFAAGLFVFTQLVPFGSTRPTPAGAAVQAAAFFIFLTPFGFLMDGFLYNRWLKRQRG
jgi:hypothetical protein